jgi:hypothetical protein
VRIDGDVLFPDDGNGYLGVMYGFSNRAERTDFGLIYIKGNDSYLQANPHRDYNVSRTLYPERRVPLRGDAAIEIGRWQRFRVEVDGEVCHFYVGDLGTPQMTFREDGRSAGGIGFQPRSVGSAVWVDNVAVAEIERLSYTGPPIPAPAYDPDALLTSWQVAGPFGRTRDGLAERPADSPRAWRPLATDARGAVITGRVVDYHGPRTVAYFRTQVTSPDAGRALLHVSTVDDLALWVNGRFRWFISRQPLAWFDFWTNPAHQGQRIPVPLVAGANDLVLRVRGGVYASGGFFARVERP